MKNQKSSNYNNRNHNCISSSLSTSKIKIPKIKFQNVLLNNPKILLRNISHHSLNTSSRNLLSLSYATKTRDTSLPYIRYVNHNDYYKLSNSFNLSEVVLKGESSSILKRSSKNSIKENNNRQYNNSSIDYNSNDLLFKKRISNCIKVNHIQKREINKEYKNKRNKLIVKDQIVSTSYSNKEQWRRNKFIFLYNNIY